MAAPNKTLSTEEYTALAERAAEDVYRLSTDPSKWPTVVQSDNGIKIVSRKSENPAAKEAMLLLVTTLPASVNKLALLLSPWGPYRLQWDEMLEAVDLLERMPNEVYLLRHLVKKRLTLSARESIDVVKVVRKENGEVVFGSTSTTHAQYQPVKGYVRTQQHLGGYVLQPTGAGETRFSMLFHADLNLPGPRFLSSVADRFKPKLMVEKIGNLRAAIAKIPLEEDEQ